MVHELLKIPAKELTNNQLQTLLKHIVRSMGIHKRNNDKDKWLGCLRLYFEYLDEKKSRVNV